MKKKVYAIALALSLIVVASVTAFSLAGTRFRDAVRSSMGGPSNSGLSIGETMPDFKAPDLSGAERSLASIKGSKGTVLIFISVQCPVSNAYNERMQKLAEDYQSKGINVVGVNANATEPVDAVRSHASSHNLAFTILKDNGNRIADVLGAQYTPEAYLFDSNNKLVYHGRIDNSKDPSNVQSNDLRAAMDELLAGRPVSKTTARAFGCTIKRG